MYHAYQYNVCMSEGMCMLWFNFILAGVDSFATYAYDCRIIFSVFLDLKTKNSSGQLPGVVHGSRTTLIVSNVVQNCRHVGRVEFLRSARQ